MKNYYKLKDEIAELKLYVSANTSFDMEIRTTEYPMTITFRERDDQIDMLSEDVPKDVPELCFVFDLEMSILASKYLKIDETVFNKLKNKSKAINTLYLHAFREEAANVVEPLFLRPLKTLLDFGTDEQRKEF